MPISHLPNVAPCSGTWLCQAPCPSRDVWGCWVRMHHEGFSQHFPCTQVPWKSPSSGVDQERELPQRFSPHCTKTLGMPPVAPTSPNSIPTLLLRHYPHLSVWICLVVEKVKSLNHQSLEVGWSIKCIVHGLCWTRNPRFAGLDFQGCCRNWPQLPGEPRRTPQTPTCPTWSPFNCGPTLITITHSDIV